MSSGQMRTPTLVSQPPRVPLSNLSSPPAFPQKLVFPTYSNVLVSKQSYVQVVNDKQTIVNNNIFCIVPPNGLVLPSHQKMHKVSSSKKRKRSPNGKESKAKRARHDKPDPEFCTWVQTLNGAEELNLSKKLSGKFVDERLEKLNWKNEQNVAYLAEHLPLSVTSLNFTFFMVPCIFWKHLFCPERITTLDCTGLFHFVDPSVLKPLTGVKTLCLSTIHEAVANKLVMPQLKKLCLNDIPNANDSNVLHFLTILKQVSNCDLEVLELNNNRIVGAMFASLVLLVPGLQSLEVSFQEIPKHSMTAANIASLLQLPKLKHLSLYDNQLGDESLQVLAKSQEIEELDIGGNPITDVTVLSLLHQATNLKKLNIEDTNVVLCAEVRRLLQQANCKLQYLNIRGCANEKELQDIVAECSSSTRSIIV